MMREDVVATLNRFALVHSFDVEAMDELQQIGDHDAEQRDLIHRLQLEAQIHAQEARAANATIAEIYQVVSGGTGEPGNWHGAEPVRTVMREQREEIRLLEEKLKGLCCAHGNALMQIHDKREEITRLRDILRLFVNAVGEECRLDHHGYCQAHSLSDPCEVKLAKQAITQEPT